MRLPRGLYESLPFLYLIAGGTALIAAFGFERQFWDEACAGAGLVAVIFGLVLLLRRKGYRASRSRLDFDA